MKLLVDENAPRTLVEMLRCYGYDLLWIREQCRGLADEKIIQLAINYDNYFLSCMISKHTINRVTTEGTNTKYYVYYIHCVKQRPRGDNRFLGRKWAGLQCLAHLEYE